MPQDDTTLENAGPFGRRLADGMVEKVTQTIDGMPDSSAAQRAAIARLVADSLYDYVEEVDRPTHARQDD